MIHDFNEAHGKQTAVKQIVEQIYATMVETLARTEQQATGLTFLGIQGTKLRDLLVGSVLMDLAGHCLNGLVDVTGTQERLEPEQVHGLAHDMLDRSLQGDLEKRQYEFRRVLNLIREAGLTEAVRRPSEPSS